MRPHTGVSHVGTELAGRLGLSLLTLTLAWGCESTLGVETRPRTDIPAEDFQEPDETGFTARDQDADDDFPVTGIDTSRLTVTRVDPRAGTVQGGNMVRVIGSGFTADALVFIDGRMAQPRDTLLVSENTLTVVMPAGKVGPADVRVQIPDADNDGEFINAVAEDGYTYHGLFLEPLNGSVAGNTLVSITVEGAELEEGMDVAFGGDACTAVSIVTPNRLTCRTPAATVGEVDVEVTYPDGGETLLAPDAYEYVDNAANVNGGLAGGPISGSVNVRVLDRQSNAPLPGAFVMLGNDTKTALRGYTDATGQLTLSSDLLRGPVTLHVSLDCYISTSFVAMDASNVTALLEFAGELRCAEQGDPPPGGGRGVAGALVSGELIFPGSREFGANPWDAVPEPRDDEERVTYIYTTKAGLFSSEVNPARGGTTNRILEVGALVGRHGYPYKIFARPAGLAVYALAGLERTSTGEFIPYIMGVARNVVTAPGEETTGVDIMMNIPLDRRFQVALSELPDGTATGPLEYRVQAHLDLGGEGIVARRVSGALMDVRESFTGGGLFDFFAQPAFVGTLADARYVVVSGWYTGGYDAFPYTEVITLGVEPDDEPLTVAGFLGIPVAEAPADGAELPEDRVVRFGADGAVPDMYIVGLESQDLAPLWRFIVPGDVHEVPIPDLSEVEGAARLPGGFLNMVIRGVKIDGFEFNRFDYGALRGTTWTHDAVNSTLIQNGTLQEEAPVLAP